MISVEVDPSIDWAEYERISIAYEATTRIDCQALGSGKVFENQAPLLRKNYDDYPEERPSAIAVRFEGGVTPIAAKQEGKLVGGSILVHAPTYELLSGRSDTAVLADIRVAPSVRGQGVGRKIVGVAASELRRRGFEYLIAETQDTNPAACRFYRCVGFEVDAIEPGAYGAEMHETRIIWCLKLRS